LFREFCLESCENAPNFAVIKNAARCYPDDAEIPFDWILAEVMGKRGPYEFILSEPARCPNCKHEITEKTLVEPKEN
jgi:hypothetical protein